jgi:hypothetical protein
VAGSKRISIIWQLRPLSICCAWLIGFWISHSLLQEHHILPASPQLYDFANKIKMEIPKCAVGDV